MAVASYGWAVAAIAASADGAATLDPATPSGGYADFDRSLLAGAGQNTADLSRFERGNPILPGIYNTDVYMNGTFAGRADVRFAGVPGQGRATPCVDEVLLNALGVHPTGLTDEARAQLKDPAACVGIGTLISDASLNFDLGSLRLDASIPQAYLGQTPRGYVAPEYWDPGVSAAFLNYNLNGYHSTSQGQSQNTAYVGLNAGLNLDGWHFRDMSTYDWQSASGGHSPSGHWQTIQAFVQRDLSSLRAQLTLGDSFSDGQVFDSYGIRGIQLATDDRMLPQSLQGYAPVVQGVAQTNARVTVRQNGIQIYQTTVAPGPFAIHDLFPTGYGGDLEVTITEADGRIRTFSVPYASVAQLLRPGVTRFDIVAGQLRNNALEREPSVAQATIQHGFNNLLTGYAGVAASQGYGAALVGGAINTRFGAVALDLTQARAEIPGESTQTGQSMRITYSKIIPDTMTSLTVAADRYSTGGFLSLTQAATVRDLVRRGIQPYQELPQSTAQTIDGVPVQSVLTQAQQSILGGTAFTTNPILSNGGLLQQRNSFTLSLNQRLGQHGGSLYANVIVNDYWNRNGTDTQFQVGYNNTFRHLGYSISATRTRDPLGRLDNQYFVSFTLPLGDALHAPTVTFNASDSNGISQGQAMLNGIAGEDGQFNYGASATYGNNGAGTAGSINGGYLGRFGQLDASYGKGSHYSQASVTASGSVLAHPGGVTLGQALGDTVGILYAPGAEGAKVQNAIGARVDGSGYAIVPYLMPYSLNSIQIDPKGLPLDVQLDSTGAQVAPYAGAVVMMKFKTQSGRTLIVHAHLPDGDAPPFGAEVVNSEGATLGVVGQAGQILVRGVDQSGQLFVRWQDADGTPYSCSFPYRLAPRAKGEHATTYEQIDAICSVSSAALSLGKAP